MELKKLQELLENDNLNVEQKKLIQDLINMDHNWRNDLINKIKNI